jgi:protein-S-isoprenylcysteine O-methyltransferase Ste14
MSRVLCFVYGLLAYVIGVPTLVYAIGFLIDQVVPKGINDGEVVPASQAIMVNVALLLLVPVQHSIMARPSFKKNGLESSPKPSNEVHSFWLQACSYGFCIGNGDRCLMWYGTSKLHP